MKTYTEQEWKDQYKDYEGDGRVPSALVVVEWDDPSETPSEAIARLNQEAVELAKRPSTTDIPQWLEGLLDKLSGDQCAELGIYDMIARLKQ